MRTYHLLQKTAILVLLVLSGLGAAAQVQVKGTVYDRSARIRMAGVSVMSTSGAGTVTDSMGRYSIKVSPGDSISFSYQGKATQKFPVKELPPNKPFEVSLHVQIHTLPTVVVQERFRNYETDSIAHRNEYRKVFDYEPEYLSSVNGVAGFNLDMLFNTKRRKRMESFRRYLEQEERERYVDHRFNRELVARLTGLKSPALDTFMVEYRPSYEMLQGFENEYEYYRYIRESGRAFSDTWKQEHPVMP